MLSPLQDRVAGLVAELEEARDFALAGGAALIVQGTITRQTRDLDFFGPEPGSVDRLLPRVEEALAAAGMTVERVMVQPGFARLAVCQGENRVELDLAADARLLAPEATRPAPTVSGMELGADKVLAIFSRAEARDFADLLMLERKFGLEPLLELAGEKDKGFRPKYFAEMLDRFERFRREEFDLSDRDFDLLVSSISRWRDKSLELSRDREPPRRERGSGIELGL